ncbi:MAG: FHA domain-containing protein [Verrucomicrobiota bacterium]
MKENIRQTSTNNSTGSLNSRGRLRRNIRRTYKLDILSFGALKPFLCSHVVETGLIELESKKSFVTRSSDDTCSIQDGVIYISDPSISHQHCSIEVNEDTLIVRDLHSENGIYTYNSIGELERSEVIRVREKEEFFIGHIPMFFHLRRTTPQLSATPLAPSPEGSADKPYRINRASIGTKLLSAINILKR